MGFPGYDGWTVTLDPPAVAEDRVELDLNDFTSGLMVGGTASGGTGIDWGQATITAFESQEGQYGNTVADLIYPNRQVTIPMVIGGADPETAHQQLRQKVGLFQREGGQILRQRAGGPAMYADVVNATLTDPDTWLETAGIEADVQLVLECLPDFYGDEIQLDTMTGSGFIDQLLQQGGEDAVIGGDYPARCRFDFSTTSATLSADGIIWGVRSRYYSANAAARITFTPAQMAAYISSTPSAVAGTYDGTAIVTTMPTAGGGYSAAALGSASSPLQSVGTYRVIVRAKASGAGAVSVWVQTGAVQVNAAAAISGGFDLLDLGVVTNFRAAPNAAPDWTAGIYAAGSVNGQTISIDRVWLVPLDEGSAEVSSFSLSKVGTGEIGTAGSFSTESGFSSATTTIGDLIRLPPSGMEQRPVEVFLKTSGLAGGTDAFDTSILPFSVTPYYRPCWMFLP